MILLNEEETLRARIKKIRTPEEMRNFLSSEEVTISAMRHAIVEQCERSRVDHKETLVGVDIFIHKTNTYNPGFLENILQNREIMELLVFSGECGNMCNALDILETLLSEESGGEMPAWKLNLAVATALTFASEVRVPPPFVGQGHYTAWADGNSPVLHALTRYHKFVRWAEEGRLFGEFYEMSVWHMRHVLGARVTNEELEWAYHNVKKTYTSIGRIGYVSTPMIAHRRERMGVWYEDVERYYQSRNITLRMIQRCGGGTGAIAHFGAAMAQARGAPAVILFNPKTSKVTHAWYRGRAVWILATSAAGGWDDLFILPGYECTCNIHHGAHCIFHHPDNYKKLKLVPATTLFEMGRHQAAPHAWRVAHNATFVATLMREEWQLDMRFPGVADMFTSFYNTTIHGISHLLGDNPSYTLASLLSCKPPHHRPITTPGGHARQLLPVKKCTLGHMTVDLQLEHMSWVQMTELLWHERKVTPKIIEIRYTANGDVVLSTTSTETTPSTLVDGVSISFTYEGDHECFNIFKMLRLCTYGWAYEREFLLDVIIDQRVSEPARTCLKVVQNTMVHDK